MLTMRKILLPVDFSERSESAAHQGAALARRFGSEMVLLYVQSLMSYHLGAGALEDRKSTL